MHRRAAAPPPAQTFALEPHTVAPVLFAFGTCLTVMAVAAARCPSYSSLLASIVSVVTMVGFDPYNDAASGLVSGRIPEGSLDLAAYGALPFLFSVVLLPRFDVLALACLGHAVRARVLACACVCIRLRACVRGRSLIRRCPRRCARSCAYRRRLRPLYACAARSAAVTCTCTSGPRCSSSSSHLR